MGVTKKPAVIAKTARKVRISATEAAFAKSQGMSLEELAKSKLPKRGRPVGSKNKPKAGKELAKLGGTISSTGWVPPIPVDWEKLAKQLQEALAKEMKENEEQEQFIKVLKACIEVYSNPPFISRIKMLFLGHL